MAFSSLENPTTGFDSFGTLNWEDEYEKLTANDCTPGAWPDTTKYQPSGHEECQTLDQSDDSHEKYVVFEFSAVPVLATADTQPPDPTEIPPNVEGSLLEVAQKGHSRDYLRRQVILRQVWKWYYNEPKVCELQERDTRKSYSPFYRKSQQRGTV